LLETTPTAATCKFDNHVRESGRALPPSTDGIHQDQLVTHRKELSLAKEGEEIEANNHK
jgi:hypothetical protein